MYVEKPIVFLLTLCVTIKPHNFLIAFSAVSHVKVMPVENNSSEGGYTSFEAATTKYQTTLILTLAVGPTN